MSVHDEISRRNTNAVRAALPKIFHILRFRFGVFGVMSSA